MIVGPPSFIKAKQTSSKFDVIFCRTNVHERRFHPELNSSLIHKRFRHNTLGYGTTYASH